MKPADNPPKAAATPTPAAHSTSMDDLLTRTRDLLAADRAGEALTLLDGAGIGSPAVQNARAVCCLRLGRPGRAVEILRQLVFHPTGLAVRSDAHPLHQANYATALLLDGNTDGFFGILAGIRDRSHPAVVRLNGAVRKWKAGMTWGQWLRSHFGTPPPLTLDYPPGEV